MKDMKLKKVKRLRYYYHLTSENWGKKVVLYPRIEGDYRGEEEPCISRTCVSSEIAGCMVAIPCSQFSSMNVYRTETKVEATHPYDIVDSHITNEYWLISEVAFVFIGSINKNIFLRPGIGRVPFGFRLDKTPNGTWLGDGNEDSLCWQKKCKIVFRKRLKMSEYWYDRNLELDNK